MEHQSKHSRKPSSKKKIPVVVVNEEEEEKEKEKEEEKAVKNGGTTERESQGEEEAHGNSKGTKDKKRRKKTVVHEEVAAAPGNEVEDVQQETESPREGVKTSKKKSKKKDLIEEPEAEAEVVEPEAKEKKKKKKKRFIEDEDDNNNEQEEEEEQQQAKSVLSDEEKAIEKTEEHQIEKKKKKKKKKQRFIEDDYYTSSEDDENEEKEEESPRKEKKKEVDTQQQQQQQQQQDIESPREGIKTSKKKSKKKDLIEEPEAEVVEPEAKEKKKKKKKRFIEDEDDNNNEQEEEEEQQQAKSVLSDEEKAIEKTEEHQIEKKKKKKKKKQRFIEDDYYTSSEDDENENKEEKEQTWKCAVPKERGQSRLVIGKPDPKPAQKDSASNDNNNNNSSSSSGSDTSASSSTSSSSSSNSSANATPKNTPIATPSSVTPPPTTTTPTTITTPNTPIATTASTSNGSSEATVTAPRGRPPKVPAIPMIKCGVNHPPATAATSRPATGNSVEDEYGSYGFGQQQQAPPQGSLTPGVGRATPITARPQIKTAISMRIHLKSSLANSDSLIGAGHKKICSNIPAAAIPNTKSSSTLVINQSSLSTSTPSLPPLGLSTSGSPLQDSSDSAGSGGRDIPPPPPPLQQQSQQPQPLAATTPHQPSQLGKTGTPKLVGPVVAEYIPPPPPPVWESYLYLEPISESNYYLKEQKFYGAKMARLLEWLSPSDELADSEKRVEMRYFALSYKTHLAPEKFFELLVKKFKVPEGAVPRERIYIVQENTLHFIWEWVKACFRSDIYPDSTLYSRISHFLGRIDKSEDCDASVKRTAKELHYFLRECKKSTRELLKDELYIIKYADAIKPLKSRADICSINPEELVQQLIVVEQDLIKRISPSEFTKCAWSKKDCAQIAPYVSRMASLFNTVSNWLVESVLLVDSSFDRHKLLKYITACAEAAFRLNDFNALLIFLSAAQSRCISRLKKSWKPKNKAIIDGFSDLMENNFREIRRLQTEKSPYVPYLGLTLQDLTFIEQGNKDFVSGKPDIVNWFKLHLIGTNVDKFLRCQNRYYDFAPNEKIIRIICSLKSVMNETESYERSLKIEPRDTIIV